MPHPPRSRRWRGVTLQEPIVWLVIVGILAGAVVGTVGQVLDRSSQQRTSDQLEQLGRVVQANQIRQRDRGYELAHFATPELVETTGAVLGNESSPTVSIAVAADGLDAVASMVADSGDCVALTVIIDQRPQVAVRDDVDVAAGECRASLLLP